MAQASTNSARAGLRYARAKAPQSRKYYARDPADGRRCQRLARLQRREIVAQRLAYGVEPRQRAKVPVLRGQQPGDLLLQRRLAADAADAHARTTRVADTRVGADPEAGLDRPSGEIIADRRRATIASELEYLLEVVADRPGEPTHRPCLVAIGGHLEHQMRLPRTKTGESVEAHEVNAALAVERPKLFGESRPGGVAELLDCPLRRLELLGIERGDDGDHDLIHRGVPSNLPGAKWRGRWAGNGPAHSTAPIAIGRQRSRAATSNGICQALMPRPAQGCSPPPVWR